MIKLWTARSRDRAPSFKGLPLFLRCASPPAIVPPIGRLRDRSLRSRGVPGACPILRGAVCGPVYAYPHAGSGAHAGRRRRQQLMPTTIARSLPDIPTHADITRDHPSNLGEIGHRLPVPGARPATLVLTLHSEPDSDGNAVDRACKATVLLLVLHSRRVPTERRKLRGAGHGVAGLRRSRAESVTVHACRNGYPTGDQV